MRRIFAPLVLLACVAAFAGCMESTTTTDSRNSNANSATSANAVATPSTNAANSNGAREGTGPGGTGIGGTSEGNRNAAVAGNSNVEPTGVNRNVGATPAANRNR